MNKTDLTKIMAAEAGISIAAAGKALDAALSGITDALASNDTVSFIGFGSFSVKERSARQGRNIQTGEVINIPASKVPHFKAGKSLKDAVKK